MKTLNHTILIASLLAATAAAQDGKPLFKVPIRNITKVAGTMNNMVQGFGLVTGLKGNGAKGGVSRRALANAIKRYGINVTENQITTGNVAIVSVEAYLTPFSHIGGELAVYVQVITDADSLEGGMLLPTELKFMDQAESEVYVTASGVISTGGVFAGGENAQTILNNPTTGMIPKGGNIVRAVSADYLTEDGNLELLLKDPDLKTATNIVNKINAILDKTGAKALVLDPALLRITLPKGLQTTSAALVILDQINDQRVAVHHPSKIVINTNTLTIVAGRGIQISPSVVQVGGLTISVIEDQEVSQPLPGINQGKTTVVNRTHLEVTQSDGQISPLSNGGATVDELMSNLKALQLTPTQLIEVFKALDNGGFLHAPLIVR